MGTGCSLTHTDNRHTYLYMNRKKGSEGERKKPDVLGSEGLKRDYLVVSFLII